MANKTTPIIRYCMAPSDSPWEPLTRPEAAQRLAIFRRHRQVTALRQPGRYERHFTDSMITSKPHSMHWWNGKFWSSEKGGEPHWRQVGDYPAWRGVTFTTFMRGGRAFDPSTKNL